MRSSSLLAAALALLALGVVAVFATLRTDPEQHRGEVAGPAGAAASHAAAPSEPTSRVAPIPLIATTPEELREVVLFCRSADRNDLPFLRRAALSSPDPLVAGNALRAMGRHQVVLDDAEVCGLLDDPRLRVRQEVVQALGRSHDLEAVTLLADVLEQGAAELTPLAIQALGLVGGHRARELVEAVSRDPESTPVELTFARATLREMR